MPRIFIQTILNASCPEPITGEWVELTNLDQDDLKAAIAEIIEQSQHYPIQRWEIGDYDGFYGLTPPLKTVLEVAQLIEEHGEAYALYAQNIGTDIADDFEDAYCGEWNSFKDYAIEQFDDVYAFNLCDYARYYINYDKVAHDLKIDYFYETSETGTVHVFRHL
ncbi:MAG: antirestriction protein ArdA [Cyanobacteria bacterium P01_A01_bin.40]